MKIFYIGVIRNQEKPALELCTEKELSTFNRFTRSSFSEFMTLFAKTVAERTRPGQRLDVSENTSVFHSYSRSEGICGVIITDDEYPQLVAHQIISKVLDEFLASHPVASFRDLPASTSASATPPISWPLLKEYIIKYQDPAAADSIMKIQKELAETKIVLHKTIESVLDRGEKIDSLVAKSDGLSSQSKMFYTQAKKQNSCCVLM